MRIQWGVDIRPLKMLNVRDGCEYWLGDIPNPSIQHRVGARYARIKKFVESRTEHRLIQEINALQTVHSGNFLDKVAFILSFVNFNN
jgi:hypothetical protein